MYVHRTAQCLFCRMCIWTDSFFQVIMFQLQVDKVLASLTVGSIWVENLVYFFVNASYHVFVNQTFMIK